MLHRLRGALEDFLPDGTTFVVYGSLARRELTQGSDVDWTLLVDTAASRRHQELVGEVRRRLKRLGLHALEHRAELIGVNAMHGPTLSADREPYEVRVRLALRAPTRAQAELVGQEVEALYLNGPGGGGGVTQTVREVVAAASALIPREAVPTDCRILEL